MFQGHLFFYCQGRIRTNRTSLSEEPLVFFCTETSRINKLPPLMFFCLRHLEVGQRSRATPARASLAGWNQGKTLHHFIEMWTVLRATEIQSSQILILEVGSDHHHWVQTIKSCLLQRFSVSSVYLLCLWHFFEDLLWRGFPFMFITIFQYTVNDAYTVGIQQYPGFVLILKNNLSGHNHFYFIF